MCAVVGSLIFFWGRSEAVTEQEWLVCSDSEKMLTFLRGKASERKMRLFLVACARLVWDSISEPTMRKAIEAAEQYADGLIPYERLEASHGGVYGLFASNRPGPRGRATMMQIPQRVNHSLVGLSLACGFPKTSLDQIVVMWSWREDMRLTGPHQPFLLREIFGHPFSPVTLNPAWLTWHDGTVKKVAQAIYEERAFDRMPILADALEEAGCTDQDILSHCRSGGEHVRGCWVVDLVLGKS
jgi:hypothetical protein